MYNSFLIFLGKAVSFVSKKLGRGNGSTWPGHIALSLNKNFIHEIVQKNNLTIIFVAGTNGKTTTTKMIQTILEKNGRRVLENTSGANLLNGIASSLVLHSTLLATLSYDVAVFEIDENTLPLALQEITPDYVILLNLFRDQLDRYGEVNTIARKWKDIMKNLPAKTTLILNADDPQIASLGDLGNNKEAKKQPTDKTLPTRAILYFGLDDTKLEAKSHQHAADSTYCPNCGKKLTYSTVYYSHLGKWHCPSCKLSRPEQVVTTAPLYPLAGTYNKYNTHAVVALTKALGIADKKVLEALQTFTAAFGRQETVIVNGKTIRIFLAKNPISFNQSLQTVVEEGSKHILFVLNDRIPDGRDVSWIWDMDVEQYLTEEMQIHVSGDRCWDMAVRLKYAHPSIKQVNTHVRLDYAIRDLLKELPKGETLSIIPTYSAMLDVRKIITGRKIL